MPIADGMLPEFDQETQNTRRALERVPDDRLAWKPHVKSGSMGWLATHLATLPSWTVETVNKDVLDIAPGGAAPTRPPEAKSRKELLETFDKQVAAARTALLGASDDHLMKPWTLQMNGKDIFSMPRVAVLRTWVMNHMIHHRAQLGLYLRLNDVPVPATYGPSADEGGM